MSRKAGTRDAQALDVGGALLATAGLAALTLGLTVLAGQHERRGARTGSSSGTGVSPTMALVALAAGMVLLIAFVSARGPTRRPGDDAAATVRHAQLRRRHPPHALPVRGPERAVRAPAVSPDRRRWLLDHGRRGGAAAACRWRWASAHGQPAAGTAHRGAPAADCRPVHRCRRLRAVLARRRRPAGLRERAAAGARGRRPRAHAQRRAAHGGGDGRGRRGARRLRHPGSTTRSPGWPACSPRRCSASCSPAMRRARPSSPASMPPRSRHAFWHCSPAFRPSRS